MTDDATRAVLARYDINDGPGYIMRAMAARIAELERVVNALAKDGLADIMLTFGHPEFGIECTAAFSDRFATVINQADASSAIINAIDAALSAEATHD